MLLSELQPVDWAGEAADLESAVTRVSGVYTWSRTYSIDDRRATFAKQGELWCENTCGHMNHEHQVEFEYEDEQETEVSQRSSTRLTQEVESEIKASFDVGVKKLGIDTSAETSTGDKTSGQDTSSLEKKRTEKTTVKHKKPLIFTGCAQNCQHITLPYGFVTEVQIKGTLRVSRSYDWDASNRSVTWSAKKTVDASQLAIISATFLKTTDMEFTEAPAPCPDCLRKTGAGTDEKIKPLPGTEGLPAPAESREPARPGEGGESAHPGSPAPGPSRPLHE